MQVSARLRAIIGSGVAGLGVFVLGGGLALTAGATSADASGVLKDYVCKYVGTPGVDERLQTGNNPIWVASDFPQGSFFNDAHGRSFVLIADTPRLDPEPDVSACPAPGGGPTDPTDPTTDPTDPTTDPTDPTTDPTDPTEPSGSIDPQPGGITTPPATDDTETPTDGAIPAGGQVPSSTAVPTAVDAGLAGSPAVGGSDREQLGQLLALLGALLAVAGAVTALTGRPQGEHQL